MICGLVNMETTVSVSGFPVEYCPIDYNFFGVNSYPAGVGLNLALSFDALSDEVCLLSMVSDDASGKMIKGVLAEHGISTEYIKNSGVTAQSVVLYDQSGRRRIFCDLKDLQEKFYDEELFRRAVPDCDMLCLCNINFSRNLLKIAKEEYKKPVACDVHVLSDIYDDYNRDFMRAADVLFLSNENIIGREREFVKSLYDEYGCDIIVCGCGNKGALMYVAHDDRFFDCPAVHTRDVVNTVGAGDALFSSFVHFYSKGCDPYTSLRYAVVYASYKIGESGASKGFIPESELITLFDSLNK